MPRSPSPADVVDQIRRMQEEIRQLRIRSRYWTWMPLSPYLCGGWIDPLEQPTPYRYETGWAPGPDTSQAGFFDTGQALVFTGYIGWDPNGWWATPPITGSLIGGVPDVAYDAATLVQAGRDGFGNTVTGVDAGTRIPWRLSFSQFFELPQYDDSGNLNTATNGARMRVLAQGDSGGITLSFITVSQGGGRFCDAEGFTHEQPVDSSQWSLSGMVLKHEGMIRGA